MLFEGFIPVHDSAEFEEFCNTYPLGEKDAPELVFGQCEIKSTVKCRINTVLRHLQNQSVVFDGICFENCVIKLMDSILMNRLAVIQQADLGLETMTFRNCVFRNVELGIKCLTQCVFEKCMFESDSTLSRIWYCSKRVEFRSCNFNANGTKWMSNYMQYTSYTELSFIDCSFAYIPVLLFEYRQDASPKIVFNCCRFYRCGCVSHTDILAIDRLVFSECSFHSCGFKMRYDPTDIHITFEQCLFSDSFVVVSDAKPDRVNDQFYLDLGITRETSGEFKAEEDSLKVPITKWLKKHAALRQKVSESYE